MRIQYISDIHLEYYDPKNEGVIQPELFLTPNAEYLALCGDIGIPDLASYKPFLTWCSQHWKTVFILAGNHEYYNQRVTERTSMEQKKKMIKLACVNLPNVYFLDCDSVWIESEKVRVLGCTFWSEVHDEVLEKARFDFTHPKQILLDSTTPATPEVLRELHRIEVDWLRSEIKKASLLDEKVLVLTHYLPSYKLIAEKFWGYEMSSCFASDRDELIRHPVAAWICGHSHHGKYIVLKGTICALNPHGYPNESVPTRNKAAVLEIQCCGA